MESENQVLRQQALAMTPAKALTMRPKMSIIQVWCVLIPELVIGTMLPILQEDTDISVLYLQRTTEKIPENGDILNGEIRKASVRVVILVLCVPLH